MRTFVYVLVAVLLVGGAVLYRFMQPAPPTELEPSATPAPASVAKVTPKAAPAPAVLPHAGEIAEQMDEQMNHQPTPEEEEEEAKTDEEEVLEALQSLKSADPEERIAGVEQLGAFPTAEAEQQLVVTLGGDSDPDVRSAAAQSLAQFETVTDQTVAALLAALEDKSGDVQTSALDAIESVTADLEAESDRFKMIVAELKKKKSSKDVKTETRQAIKDFLDDQAS